MNFEKLKDGFVIITGTGLIGMIMYLAMLIVINSYIEYGEPLNIGIMIACSYILGGFWLLYTKAIMDVIKQNYQKKPKEEKVR